MNDDDIRWLNETLTWPMVFAIPLAVLFVGIAVAETFGFILDVLRAVFS